MPLQAYERGYEAMARAVECLPPSFRGCRPAIAQKAIELFPECKEDIISVFYNIEVELGVPKGIAFARAEELYKRT